MKPNKIVIAFIAAGLYFNLGSAIAGNDADRIMQLEKQLKAMQDQINELKKSAQSPKSAPAASSAALEELKNQVEAQGKESVVVGDIPGSFRIPGSQTSVRVYGYAEAHWLKDFKTTAPGDDFSNIAEQPTYKNASKGKSKFTVQTSRFGIETSTPTAVGSFNTKLEADFYSYCNGTFYNNGSTNADGNNSSRNDANDCNRNRLRLRHAYGEYAGFLIGQTWSTWMDIDNSPETIDFNGPIGGPFARNPMIRYSHDIPNIATFKIALEDPFAWGSASNNNAVRTNSTGWTGTISQNRPNLVLRVDKSFDWGQLTARYLSSNIRIDGVSKSATGYGVGGTFKPTSSDTLYGQYNVVKGDYNWEYMVGANGVAAARSDINSLASDIYNDKSTGIILGWGHVFSPQWRANLAYSATTMKESEAYLANYGGSIDGNNLPNKKLTQYHLNLIYTPIKNVDLGIEYVGGKRRTYADQATGEVGIGKWSRLDFMGRYSF